MSAENISKRCRDCSLGNKRGGGELNLPIKTGIPLGILITPRIRRNCLNRFEIIKDSLLSKIEDAIDYDIPIERNEHIVTFTAKCVKPDSFTPREFGYDPTKVWYRQRQHLQTIDGNYRGVQAKVTFEETSYQDVFDKALKELKEFADKGVGNHGWRSDDDKSKWGQFNEIELPNHQKYRVVDRTKDEDKGITLSIEHEEGSYKFTGRGEYSVRAIDISDARTKMKRVNQVMEEIKTIVEAVSEY